MAVACGRNPQTCRGSSQMVGAYDFEATIGKGHFAVVKQARHVFTGEKVAVKVFDKHRLDASSSTNLLHEIRCMKLVRHPNIVRLYEVIDTQSKIFLILELGDYDLYDYITRKAERGLVESRARGYFSQIVEAIAYCHKLHVVHRDLKPENVVVFENLDLVKLTDFGLSHLFTPGQPLKTSCGSLAYSAPEILLGNSYDAPAIDVWSLGVILYMLVCGRLPFQGASDSETLTMILDCAFLHPSHVSPECKELILRTLVRDPSARMSLAEILSSDWLKQGNYVPSDEIPLIKLNDVSEEMCKGIVEQMVNGGVGDAEQIYEALEKDEYNHLSATYYLLAERILKNLRLERDRNLPPSRRQSESAGGASAGSGQKNSDAIFNCQNGMPLALPEPSWHKRHCSIVAEESEDDVSSLGMSMCSYHLSLSRNSSRISSRRQSASVLLSPGSLGSGSFRNVVAQVDGLFCAKCARHRRSCSFAGLESEFRKLRRNMSFPFLMKINEEEEEDGVGGCSDWLPSYPKYKRLFCCHFQSVHKRISMLSFADTRTKSCDAIPM